MYTSLLSLASFNEIFSLAVGLNVAYILVNKYPSKENTFSLFSFVSSVISLLALKAIAIKTEDSKRVTKLVALGQGYVASGLLKHDTQAVLAHNIDRAKVIKQKIEDLNADVRKRISNENCIKTVNLPFLAFDCAVYGFILIFSAALESDLGIDLHPFVSILNIAIIALAVYCTVFENHPTEKWYKPSTWTHILLLVFFVFIGIIYPKNWIIASSIFWKNITYCLAVVLSMTSLIAYLINCFLKCRKEFNASMVILNRESFSGEIKFREQELASYQSEINDIEKELKKDIKLQIEPDSH